MDDLLLGIDEPKVLHDVIKEEEGWRDDDLNLPTEINSSLKESTGDDLSKLLSAQVEIHSDFGEQPLVSTILISPQLSTTGAKQNSDSPPDKPILGTSKNPVSQAGWDDHELDIDQDSLNIQVTGEEEQLESVPSDHVLPHEPVQDLLDTSKDPVNQTGWDDELNFDDPTLNIRVSGEGEEVYLPADNTKLSSEMDDDIHKQHACTYPF